MKKLLTNTFLLFLILTTTGTFASTSHLFSHHDVVVLKGLVNTSYNGRVGILLREKDRVLEKTDKTGTTRYGIHVYTGNESQPFAKVWIKGQNYEHVRPALDSENHYSNGEIGDSNSYQMSADLVKIFTPVICNACTEEEIFERERLARIIAFQIMYQYSKTIFMEQGATDLRTIADDTARSDARIRILVEAAWDRANPHFLR